MDYPEIHMQRYEKIYDEPSSTIRQPQPPKETQYKKTAGNQNTITPQKIIKLGQHKDQTENSIHNH